MKRSYRQPKKRKWKGRSEKQKARRAGDPDVLGGKGNRRESHSKVCIKCEEEKTLDKFDRVNLSGRLRARDPKKYKSYCKECVRAPSARDVDPNWEPDRPGRPIPKRRNKTAAEKRASAAAYKRKKRRDTRIKALEYMAEKGCAECGERDPRVLEFDHLDPTEKSHAISQLTSDGFGWGSERLRVEIRKCRVLCVRCHRLHTHEQMEYYAHDDIQSALRGIYGRYGIKS